MSHPLASKVADAYLRKQGGGMDPKFIRAVANALSLWDQKEPLAEGMTVPEAMRVGAAELAWRTLSGEPNQARWAQFTDDPRKLVQFLQRALQRPYQEAL